MCVFSTTVRDDQQKVPIFLLPLSPQVCYYTLSSQYQKVSCSRKMEMKRTNSQTKGPDQIFVKVIPSV